MKKAKQLKFWNGRPHGTYMTMRTATSFNVAAYSVAEAVRIINEKTGAHITSNEIKEYYSPCWGNDMTGIEPTEPVLYVFLKGQKAPIKL